MTEHRTMNTIIHAAFRRDLARFDRALAAFPDGSRSRADQLKLAWDNYAHQLDHHHQDEETIFFPALRGLGATDAMVGELEDEHAAMLRALEAASTAMTNFQAEPSAGNASAARDALGTLRGTLQTHLDHEERDLEPFAAKQKDTPQMKAAQNAVRKAHTGEAGSFLAWLSDGAAPADKAALRREIPAPVLFVLTRVAGRDYNRRIAPVWA